jgi:preprotein translocase subunit SecE
VAVASQPREQQSTTARPPGQSRPFAFLRGVVDELRKVVWPTPPELYRYTVVVVVTVAIIALFIGGADLLVGSGAAKFIYQASPAP